MKKIKSGKQLAKEFEAYVYHYLWEDFLKNQANYKELDYELQKLKKYIEESDDPEVKLLLFKTPSRL